MRIKKFESFVNEHNDIVSNIMTISPEEASEVADRVVNRGNEVALLLTAPDERVLDNLLNVIASELPTAKDHFSSIYKIVSTKKFESFVNEESMASDFPKLDDQDFLQTMRESIKGTHQVVLDPQSKLFDALVKNQNMSLQELDGITILDASVDPEEDFVFSNYKNQLIAIKADNADEDLLNEIFTNMLNDYKSGNSYVFFCSDPYFYYDLPVVVKNRFDSVLHAGTIQAR